MPVSGRRLARSGGIALAVVAAVALARPARRWLRIDMCLDQGGRWSHAAGVCELSEDASRREPRRDPPVSALAAPVCVDSAATHEARIMAALATAQRESHPPSDTLNFKPLSVADSAGGLVVQTGFRDGRLALDMLPRIFVPREGCAIALPGDSV